MPAKDLREDALACFRQAVAAVEPSRLVREHLVDGLDGERIKLVAVGKAAAAMTRGAIEALPKKIDEGVVIVPTEAAPKTRADLPLEFAVYGGGHPEPNQEGVRGAEAIRKLAESLGVGDILLCLISGGGSALMSLPPEGLSLEDIVQTTRLLLRAGATIGELNSVRKHLDQLKGGRLAAAAFPARVHALVISDVVGDPLDVIASGPVTADPTTFEDALRVLERRGLLAKVPDATVPDAVRVYLEQGVQGQHAESPKPGDPCFERTQAHIVGNNRLAADAALAEAERRGYEARLLSTTLTGEARDVGGQLADLAREARRGDGAEGPVCLVASGETTVTVRGSGRGGRNQEVALGAALALSELEAEGVLVASLGTDGVDGPTDAAGAIAYADTIDRAQKLGLDPHRALDDNDAYPFFEALGDLVRTGPTGTNVMDLMLVMRRPHLTAVGSVVRRDHHK